MRMAHGGAPFLLTAIGMTTIVIVACSSDSQVVASPADASSMATDGAVVDDGSAPSEGGSTQDVSSPLAPTKKTSLDAVINSVSRTLVRAQFGNSKVDGGPGTLYIEAHEGGQPECPDQNSPSPKRTIIIANVPRGAPGEVFTKADGIAVSFLDFTGDQLDGKPLTKALEASVTIVKIDGDASVEIELDATFPEGTAKGRVYATFCQSLSD